MVEQCPQDSQLIRKILERRGGSPLSQEELLREQAERAILINEVSDRFNNLFTIHMPGLKGEGKSERDYLFNRGEMCESLKIVIPQEGKRDILYTINRDNLGYTLMNSNTTYVYWIGKNTGLKFPYSNFQVTNQRISINDLASIVELSDYVQREEHVNVFSNSIRKRRP